MRILLRENLAGTQLVLPSFFEEGTYLQANRQVLIVTMERPAPIRSAWVTL